MSKIHDKFVIELAEVIKGYGNDPDVDDPFRLSEFYRFYELPEIAVSANHFKTMIPLEAVEKNAQPGWIPCKTKFPEKDGSYLVTANNGQIAIFLFVKGMSENYWKQWGATAWMPLPKPWKGEGHE